ncbi:unnamed protein product [Owenia fusiformis]|uniref:Cholesterol side-chain cleavage enzyme, mitochondrial n=1 Tax=Owenia fusiformis TaxID=6347 RepID=A0A8S4PJA0_OWEFU|nr:unnamed protein product [Owenia fusiformis]
MQMINTGFHLAICLLVCIHTSRAEKQCGGSVWKETDTENLALGKPASQSSIYPLQHVPAGLAVDGVEDGDWHHGSCASTKHEHKPWWMVDLREVYPIGSVKLSNRQCGEGNCRGGPSDIVEDRLSNFKIEVSKDAKKWELCTFYRNTALEPCKKGCQMFYCPGGMKGRYVRVRLQDTNWLTLCEVAVFRPSKLNNLALGKVATQSSLHGGFPPAAAAVDGNIDGDAGHFSCISSDFGDTKPWWKVDLLSQYDIGSVALFNRQCRGSDNCGINVADVEAQLKDFKIEVSKDNVKWELCAHHTSSLNSCGKNWQIFRCPNGLSGRYVKVQIQHTLVDAYLTLCEVAVFEPNKRTPCGFERQAEIYGPIYKEKLGSYEHVNIFDPDDAEYLLRRDGQYPQRVQFPAWDLYRRDRNLSMGLLMSHAEEWHKNRIPFNRFLMRPKPVAGYTEVMDEVATDMVERLDRIRKHNGLVEELYEELYNWSIESGGTMFFERRLGCLNDNRNPEITEFIKSIRNILTGSDVFFFLSPQLAKTLRLPAWKQLEQTLDTMFRISTKFIKEKIDEVQQHSKDGKKHEGLLADILQKGNLDEAGLIGSMVDLMGGAVDTTSTSAQWILYMLARNPHVQEKLYREVKNLNPGNDVSNYMQHIPYMRAVVKETLRLYPVAALVSRFTPDDITIRGYNIPKGKLVNVCLYSMGRNEAIFGDALEFKPERWLRAGSNKAPYSPFASIPFGYGVRMCVGRRVAELEMYLIITRVLQRFRIKPFTDIPIDDKMAIVLSPEKPIQLRFLDRTEEGEINIIPRSLGDSSDRS